MKERRREYGKEKNVYSSHRNPASGGTSRDSRRVQKRHKRYILYNGQRVRSTGMLIPNIYTLFSVLQFQSANKCRR
jgi:hypothetical protein